MFNTWENPFKALADRCCDQLDTFPPNCAGSCETRFEICLQPFSYSPSNRNCPYGRYLVPFDSSIPDSDNIDFAVGVNLEGEVPNPMIYSIPTDLTVRIDNHEMIDVHSRLFLSTEKYKASCRCL